MGRFHRDYARVIQQITGAGDRHDRMQGLADAIWDEFNQQGVSWVGFYIDQPDQPDDRRLVLGPCRDKPACSPIGLNGVCGQSFLAQEVRIVSDIRDLGSNYIACDPRDQSEVVIPLIESDRCWGVLDLDSHETGAFTQEDAAGLLQSLRAAMLTET